jgi:hypothetical protein
MRKPDTLKELRSRIWRLQREVDEQRNRKNELYYKADQQRMYIETKFNWFVDLMAEGKTPNLAWMIKDFKDALVRFK